MERIVSEYTKGLVSIIIPTHNREDLICETLDSIKNQTYKEIEVLVVDDHSGDNTMEVVRGYIQSHPELKVDLYENEGKGACAARNKGIRESKGEYLQFFDDDDLMLDNHIERKVEAIKVGSYGYVACNFSYFNNETKACVGHKNISNVAHNCSSHLLTKSFPCPCFMCTRSCIITIGLWNEKIKKNQDMAYFHRLFLMNINGVYLNDELFEVRIHGGSMTTQSVTSSDGYYAQYYAYTAIKDEWHKSKQRDKNKVIRSLLFLKYTIGRNMYKKGFRKQGVLLLLRIFCGNIIASISFIGMFVRNKTIHITEALLSE